LHDRFLAFSKTRAGFVTNVLAVFLAGGLIGALASDASGGTTVGGVLVGIAVGIPLGWAIAWAIVALARRAWENKTAPAPPPFARRSPSGSGGPMLRRDNNAGFWQDRGGFLFAKRVWFAATSCPPVQIDAQAFADMAAQHQRDECPVPVARAGDRQWWWWQDAFYWETGDYAAADVKALVFRRQRRAERELEHAHTMMALDESPEGRKREPLPEDVQRFVFRRDEGRCRKCGSRELLQFDHIIPFSMGGSNEPENLQLLCSRCNREKGGVL
jgi:HNH endonuclease